MATNYVLRLYFSGEVPQEIVLNEQDQVNVIKRCCAEKAIAHLLLGLRRKMNSFVVKPTGRPNLKFEMRVARGG